MRIPHPNIDLKTSLQEFDVWITPNLGEIRDTERYQQELESLLYGFDLLRAATNNFAHEQACHPELLVPELQHVIRNLSIAESSDVLNAIVSVLYLVTGKTDNNTKCQFPLFLRDHARLEKIPTVKNKHLTHIDLPRVFKAERLVKLVASLNDYPQQQATLLQRFMEFILADEAYISQLWSIGHGYATLKRIGKGADLLSPLAVFKVRGSVMASGGHDPENILRERLTEWGLRAGLDFNEADVTIPQLLSLPNSKTLANRKTRAYDFVLPYKSWKHGSRLFVQCQFYAGDSGSVSHKNVDQTRSTRDATKKVLSDATFIEFVDGAGYFSSLNGDLRSLLAMPDTSSFFQLRSAPIRLRRELQRIGFLTPLDLEHAILQTGGGKQDVYSLLVKEGYHEEIITRCLSEGFENGIFLGADAEKVTIHPDRQAICRRYLLLDMAAIHAKTLGPGDISGKLLIPGYGPFYGLRQNDLIRLAMQKVSELALAWQSPTVAFDDLQWLIDKRFIISGT